MSKISVSVGFEYQHADDPSFVFRTCFQTGLLRPDPFQCKRANTMESVMDGVELAADRCGEQFQIRRMLTPAQLNLRNSNQC